MKMKLENLTHEEQEALKTVVSAFGRLVEQTEALKRVGFDCYRGTSYFGAPAKQVVEDFAEDYKLIADKFKCDLYDEGVQMVKISG